MGTSDILLRHFKDGPAAFFVYGLILCWAFGFLENASSGRDRHMNLPIVVIGMGNLNKHTQVNFTDCPKVIKYRFSEKLCPIKYIISAPFSKP